MADSSEGVVHRYMDRGASGFANITLPSGERVFISLSAKGLRLHNLILWGRLPGKTLYVANADEVKRMAHVMARDLSVLPKLPDAAAMDFFLLTAARALNDPTVYREQPLDEEDFPMSNLTVLTRAALAEADVPGLVRRYGRAAATP